MSVAKQYVLDANVFIEAGKRYYGFDICPGFWHALIRQHHADRVCSIDKIRVELVNDDLKKWTKEKVPASFFKGTADKRVSDSVGQMENWVQDQTQFRPEAKAEFASAADAWLIAHARANGLVVVTEERFDAGIKRKVPIPNVCEAFGVEHCDTFRMLRDLREQFVSKTRRRRN